MTIRPEDCDASDIYGPEPYKAAPTREQQLEALIKELEGRLDRCRWAAKVADNEKARADRLQAEVERLGDYLRRIEAVAIANDEARQDAIRELEHQRTALDGLAAALKGCMQELAYLQPIVPGNPVDKALAQANAALAEAGKVKR